MPREANRGAFNIPHSTFNIPVLLAFSAVLIAASISANELSVDKRTMQLDDTVTITVMLEDAFASIDSVRVPLRNLVIEGEPSVSSEFDFINRRTSRRNTFRYTAHATAAEGALVRPLPPHRAAGQLA